MSKKDNRALLQYVFKLKNVENAGEYILSAHSDEEFYRMLERNYRATKNDVVILRVVMSLL